MGLDESLLDGNVTVVDRSFLSALERQHWWALRTYELMLSNSSHILIPSRIFSEHYQARGPKLSDMLDLPYSFSTLRPFPHDSESFRAYLQKDFYFISNYNIGGDLSLADIAVAHTALRYATKNPNVSIATADAGIASVTAYACDERSLDLEVYSPWTIHQHDFFADSPSLQLLATTNVLSRLHHTDLTDGYQFYLVATPRDPDSPQAQQIAFDVYRTRSGGAPDIDGVHFILLLPYNPAKINGEARRTEHNLNSGGGNQIALYGGKSPYHLTLLSGLAPDEVEGLVHGLLGPQEKYHSVPLAKDWHFRDLDPSLSHSVGCAYTILAHKQLLLVD